MEFVDLQIFVAALAGAFLIALVMILRVLRSPGEGPGKPAGRVKKSPVRQRSLPIADDQPVGRRRGLDAIKPDAVAVPADYYGEVEAKLEVAFEQFYSGRIGLLTYSAIMHAEEEAACRHIARLRELSGSRRIDADTFVHELGIAELALQAIRWCLKWAEAHGRSTAAGPAPLRQASSETVAQPQADEARLEGDHLDRILATDRDYA